jgi:acyl-CoA synthetase (NDP forming)
LFQVPHSVYDALRMSSTDVADNRTVLSEVEAKRMLAEAGVPIVETRLATDREAAVATASELGFPVALKVVSPQVTHKSDAGGVKLGLTSSNEVAAAYDAIVTSVAKAAPGANIEGVSVQRMAEPGIEVIVGTTTDPQFGPVLMFGLGGVLVEVLKDVAFRIVPIERRDAAQMVREIQGFPLLRGYRGQPPADLNALEELLLQVSAYVEANSQVAELDLNPVFAYQKGALLVDARIVLKEQS